MSKSGSQRLPPSKSGAELVSTMRTALNDAAGAIDQANRTPATIAKMAERMLLTASEGIIDADRLKAVAIEEGMQKACVSVDADVWDGGAHTECAGLPVCMR
jgi:hypothetical protein